ncbi:hypothetical protein ACLOJK_019472, partial [Asimina triloba]
MQLLSMRGKTGMLPRHVVYKLAVANVQMPNYSQHAEIPTSKCLAPADKSPLSTRDVTLLNHQGTQLP